jgi:hypothetical protein
MTERRVLSPNYLGVGLAIATGLAANLGSAWQARAQVPDNVQTQLNILLPPVSSLTPGLGAAVELDQTFIRAKGGMVGCVSNKKLQILADAIAGKEVVPADVKQTVESYLNSTSLNSNDAKRRAEVEVLLPIIRPNPGCASRQPLTARLSFPVNPTYENNILKSGNNSSIGESFGFGSNFLMTMGVDKRPWDLVVFNAQEASSRYNPIHTPSIDGASEQAFYQMFLHAYGYDPDAKRWMDDLKPGSPKLPPSGMMTYDTLAFGVQNQTAFTPTFRQEKSDLVTPQVTLARQNIGLDDPNAKPCGSVTPQRDGTVIDSRTFCYFANLSLTGGQTFSDIITSENVNVAASATLGWNITDSLSLTLPATATAKDYEHVVGGRRDVLLQAGPTLTYTSAPKATICSTKDTPLCTVKGSFTFSLPVTYYKNYSTVAVDAWSGWVIMPTLTFTFGYTKS